MDGERLGRLIVRVRREDGRRARLLVPEVEGVLQGVPPQHGVPELVARDGGAVVPLEVCIESPAESLPAQQRLVHAHHLCALLIHRAGVEVVHLFVEGRPDRVGERPPVLDKLVLAHESDVVDALDAAGVEIRGELLVPEDREALLEREVEPRVEGNPVAGPVVEVLVADDALDRLVRVVGGRLRGGEDEAGVEDVERLVLHGAHVEVVDHDDVELLEVVHAAPPLLVPPERLRQ
mmetsp:Transcript_49369/g.119717  ORF Transcript_49369/g.119717 Transcript_49369/m.119717 type:complete len:235 (-) Transcript_49369:213-917(-)